MMSLPFADINLIAVFIAWVIHMAIGMIWFRPELFGKEWTRLTGRQLKPAKKWLIPGMLGHLVMILVLLVLIKMTHINNGLDGLFIGFLTWLGFIVPMEIGELIWEKIPFKLFLLRIGNQWLGILASSFILGALQ